jgi:hypothetical protein
MKRELLFTVRHRDTGHEYRIYTNGEIEGFPEGATIVINNYPALVAKLFAKLELEKR